MNEAPHGMRYKDEELGLGEEILAELLNTDEEGIKELKHSALGRLYLKAMAPIAASAGIALIGAEAAEFAKDAGVGLAETVTPALNTAVKVAAPAAKALWTGAKAAGTAAAEGIATGLKTAGSLVSLV